MVLSWHPVLNRYTAIGIPITEVIRYVRLGKGQPRPSPDLSTASLDIDFISCVLSPEDASLTKDRPHDTTN